MSADSLIKAAIVAGEPSGDLLAARIIQGLQQRLGTVQTMGIGGPAMQAAGFNAWHNIDALAVFGYVQALKKAPSLLKTWYNTKNRLLAKQPDVFIGVDAPDFNLRLEEKIRKTGIPTVHFVGPSIWAWRYQRIHQIRRAVSHMLVLFPFEVEIYQKEDIPVTYVGHPLAELIPKRPDKFAARRLLGLDPEAKVLAVLPGSRESELELLGARFLQAVQVLQRQDPNLQILVPVVNTARKSQFEAILAANKVLNCHMLDTKPDAHKFHERPESANWPIAWHAMEAADAVLLASGTATLETALFKRPMVISYALSPWMRRIMAWKSGQQGPSLPWVGLPNILEQDFVVPELLQDDATPEKLAEHTWIALNDDDTYNRIIIKFNKLHDVLNVNTPEVAADVIANIVDSK